jgi:hypothetical protein
VVLDFWFDFFGQIQLKTQQVEIILYGMIIVENAKVRSYTPG